jgi:hypothetical protein
MKISLGQDGDKIVFQISPEQDDLDHLEGTKISIGRNSAYVSIPGISLEEIHPDILALSSILISHQLIGNRLCLDWPVSEDFLEESNRVLSRYKIEARAGVDIERNRKIIGRPALAFSGGADSMAALAVMPGDTVPIFMNRPMKKGSLYNSEAPLKTCEMIKQMGYDVRVIASDLEYLREPIGFPSDLAHAIPAILMSEKLGIGSISFGTVLESAFGIGHKKFVDYPVSSHNRFFGTLFSAAGLRLALPIAGISEIGTSIIGMESPLGEFAQSCIRGTWMKPCMNCWKCFRKELLGLALGHETKADLLKMLKSSSEVQIKLSAFPISHENVVAFSIKKIPIEEHPYLRGLRKRTAPSNSLGFLSRWYSPSNVLIPEEWRGQCVEEICSFLGVMSESEEERVQSWNMESFLADENIKKAHFKLTSSWQDL